MRFISSTLIVAPITISALLALSCQPDEGAAAPDEGAAVPPATMTETGRLSVRIHDAPADVKGLVVSVEQLRLRRCDSDDSPWIEYEFGGVPIDLLALQGGAFETLVSQQTIEAGTFCETRLVLADAASVHLDDGTEHDLKIGSGSSSGLKIKGEFSVVPGLDTVVSLDFDVDKSLHNAGKSGSYKLNPVIRIDAVKYYEHDSISNEVVAFGDLEVPPEGVDLALGNGASISFPSGAVDVATKFEYRRIRVADQTLPSDVFVFSPSHEFYESQPTLSIPFDHALVTDVENLYVHLNGEALKTTNKDGIVSAELPHFSYAYARQAQVENRNESAASVHCYGPEEYWHISNTGLGGSMKWTMNNSPQIGVQNYCVYDFDSIRTGRYTIQAWIPPDHATATACYKIALGDGVKAEVALGQAPFFGQWVTLGTWDVHGDLSVTLTDVTSDPALSKWVGFDEIRAVPAVAAGVGPAWPACTAKSEAAAPETNDGSVEFIDDYDVGLDLLGTLILGPVDVIKFDGVAADAVRSASSDGANALVALYLVLAYEDTLTAFVAADGDLGEMVNVLADPTEIAAQEALKKWSWASDLLTHINAYLKAQALVEGVTKTRGDLYFIIAQYPEYQLDRPRLYPNGLIVIADDLDPDTLKGFNLASYSNFAYLELLDEEKRNPNEFTLGKANDHDWLTDTWKTPVSNNWTTRLNLGILSNCSEDKWCPPI